MATLRSIQARRRERGTAMVEAAAILPLFVVLWFTTLFAFRLSAAKIQVNSVSRANAWGYAMGNCNQTGDAHVTSWPGVGGSYKSDLFNLPVSQLFGSGGTMGFVGAAGSVLTKVLGPFAANKIDVDTQSKAVSYRVPQDGVVSPGYQGSFSPTYATHVFCNEAPVNGNIVGVGKALWNLIHLW